MGHLLFVVAMVSRSPQRRGSLKCLPFVPAPRLEVRAPGNYRRERPPHCLALGRSARAGQADAESRRLRTSLRTSHKEMPMSRFSSAFCKALPFILLSAASVAAEFTVTTYDDEFDGVCDA